MSFLIDIALIGILAVVVAVYARRSIFSAGFGVLVTAVAVVAALLITPFLSPTVADTFIQPLTEKPIATALADMHSAPYASTVEQTVAYLPLGEMIVEQPEGYVQLLEEYRVTPETVLEAYYALPLPMTVVHTIAKGYAAALAQAVVFLLLAVLLAVLLQFIVRRIEQNLPPQRRYRGFKRVCPPLFGVMSGLIWSFAVVTALSWAVPAMAGKLLFLTPDVLEKTDWYALLHRLNPLSFWQRMVVR